MHVLCNEGSQLTPFLGWAGIQHSLQHLLRREGYVERQLGERKHKWLQLRIKQDTQEKSKSQKCIAWWSHLQGCGWEGKVRRNVIRYFGALNRGVGGKKTGCWAMTAMLLAPHKTPAAAVCLPLLHPLNQCLGLAPCSPQLKLCYWRVAKLSLKCELPTNTTEGTELFSVRT